MAESPQFTVVIPVYNGELYLADTIRSVLAQTYPPARILVLDDGSRDGSAAIAEGFGDAIELIRKPNSGVSDTRNFGASLATTEWVDFLDHDDLWEPDHLARHAAAIQANPDADACYSGRRHLVQDLLTGGFTRTEAIPVPGAAELPALLRERCPFTPSAVSIRRSTLLAVGGFDSRHNSVEDWDLWLRLLQHGARFIQSPELTLLYRVHVAANTNNPLPVLARSLGVVRQNILPRLSPLGRLTTGNRIISRLEAEAAILLRENHLPGALPLMLRSLLRHPFHDPRRYKIAAHMLFSAVLLRLQPRRTHISAPS